MKYLLFSLLVFNSAWACELNEEKIRDDLFTNVRDLFDLSDETVISLGTGLDLDKLEKQADVAFLELLSEDRFFDQAPKSKETCPDRINRVFRFFSQDRFRRCNGILKAEVRQGAYDILYLNCGPHSK